MTLPSICIRNRVWFAMGLFLGFLLLTDAAFAANSAGGGLPFDTWFTKIRSSVTGPLAFTIAIVGLVGAGATLIFGGDLNGFLRMLIFFVLVLSFVVTAQNTLSAITGQGAEVASWSSMLYSRVS